MAGPRRLNWVRDALRVCRYSVRTEQCCIQWIKRYILFHGKRHPNERRLRNRPFSCRI